MPSLPVLLASEVVAETVDTVEVTAEPGRAPEAPDDTGVAETKADVPADPEPEAVGSGDTGLGDAKVDVAGTLALPGEPGPVPVDGADEVTMTVYVVCVMVCTTVCTTVCVIV